MRGQQFKRIYTIFSILDMIMNIGNWYIDKVLKHNFTSFKSPVLNRLPYSTKLYKQFYYRNGGANCVNKLYSLGRT